jgi:hypothetical protein
VEFPGDTKPFAALSSWTCRPNQAGKNLLLSHSTCTKQILMLFCCAAGLERIQIVGSMNPATTVGRQPLAPRLAVLMHVAYMGYPSPAHLQSVLSAMLASSLNKVGFLSPPYSPTACGKSRRVLMQASSIHVTATAYHSCHPCHPQLLQWRSLQTGNVANYCCHASVLLPLKV